MFDPGSSAGGTISSSEHDLETLAALRFGSRFVDRQIHCENCQPSQRTWHETRPNARYLRQRRVRASQICRHFRTFAPA
jgi:hypothetical protein